MTINDFIKKRPHLIWYTKDYDKLSPEAIVEAVLNYGDWDDVKKVIEILGIKKNRLHFQEEIKTKKMQLPSRGEELFSVIFQKICIKRF
jgi:hypothetical protein